jgi:hypothetical protein
MTRARLGYDFLALPRKRHPGWIGLKHSSGQFLFAPLFEIAEGAPIPIHGSDWRVWLCRIWCLSGKARSPVYKALDELAERGVIALGEGFLSVLFRPEDEHKEGTQRPKPSLQKEHGGSEQEHVSPNSGRHLDLSVGNASTPQIQTDREKERKRERESAGAHEGDFRRPVGEPPPGFVDTFEEPKRAPAEPTLEDQILTAWKFAVHTKTLRTPGSTKLATDGAAEVAKWLRDNVRGDETPLSAFQVALKLYVAEDKKSLVDSAWPLKWLTERLPGYLAAKQPEQRTVRNPTHAEWKVPDYEAENRAINARVEREQQEWWAQHPELRPSAEDVERERELLKPRVVVSIEEAPKPRVCRPKTAEELEERRRFLQEQAKQLMAAAASK